MKSPLIKHTLKSRIKEALVVEGVVDIRAFKASVDKDFAEAIDEFLKENPIAHSYQGSIKFNDPWPFTGRDNKG